MSAAPPGPLSVAAAATVTARFRVNPFLHVGPQRLYDPLQDRMIEAREQDYAVLAEVVAGTRAIEELPLEVQERLAAQGWLLPAEEDAARRFRLRYVSLESVTTCNQACYFCPVSIAPREDYQMPTELYERIVGELAPFSATIEAVFMINYNEPTVDKRFVELVAMLRQAGLPPAVLTNATGLTPARVDALLAVGGLRYLSVNLSTLDRERYQRERGADHLELVLRNLDYLKDLSLAAEMDLVVLGQGDAVHEGDFRDIAARFAGSRFRVKRYEVMDRAGYLQIGLRPKSPLRRLRGCENNGSRPLQHLHVTPRGKAVFCCEDYDEYHVIGDLTQQSVLEVLTGDEIAQLRRWSYGVESAPANFICRKCVYALDAD